MESILSFVLARQSVVAGVNSIFGMYCKGAVHVKGNKILAGSLLLAYLIYDRTCMVFVKLG